ncbi:5-formyltetrahydrofolate cyclo-ligase [Salirhabdus salicampi]|uniref:5-formyltetrahydrofolate cyclo-ligase n=1 Tax=Salirhabdus salicampi TaxID=476102 RepID=UPI0020C2DF76|nr:5-formyltetrahydrofolate cyclo-ligase [Salirhabdus salicampi]MCP8617373.1 5-formyltetrahydrofolate cyclo-ligase [Salirhabdus salicampi]
MKGKHELRDEKWTVLEEKKLGRFPFPIRGRIPNFKGAEAAAKYVIGLMPFKQAQVIKINPDAPQLPLREQVLKQGKTLLIPTPRLKAGFIKIEPHNVPDGEERRAASLSHMKSYGSEIPLTDIPMIDLFVVGSVAVQTDGRRIGKGEGYADREYAILRELGNPEIPVITTVHSVQITDEHFLFEPYDLIVDYIVTEAGVQHIKKQYPKPSGINWDIVTKEEMDDMPVLRELWELKKEQ